MSRSRQLSKSRAIENIFDRNRTDPSWQFHCIYIFLLPGTVLGTRRNVLTISSRRNTAIKTESVNKGRRLK